MKIRAVIFDLYGVLGMNGWQEFKKQHFDGRWDEWDPLRRLGQRVDAGKATDEEFVEALSRATGESRAVIRSHFEHTNPNFKLFDYIEQNLKGNYKLGILSNTSRDVLGAIFSDQQLELFDGVVMSVSVGLTKPDPAMFHIICDQLDIMPHEAVFVDDQARHLIPAQSLGMKTVFFRDTEQVIQDIEKALKS